MAAGKFAYYRVSSKEQSIEMQRNELQREAGEPFEQEWSDEGISGAVPALQRAGFAACEKHLRKGDTLYVYAIDRLGRDSIDVQTTVRDLHAKGVKIHVHGLGLIEGETGQLILTLFAQFAQMERARIAARTEAGRATARESLAATGKTHRGKASLGRPASVDLQAVAKWSREPGHSIMKAVEHFGVSEATVNRARKQYPA
jgi:putative DNA-invertase from lambdoid prophage Rac